MTVLEGPQEDAEELRSAARAANDLTTELATQKTEVRSGVTTAIADWTGPRNELFTRAAGGVQVQLKNAYDGCVEVHGALADYAREVESCEGRIAELKRQHSAALNDAESSATGTGDLVAQTHALRRAERFVTAAQGELDDLATKAQACADRINGAVESIVPFSDDLSPEDLRRKVTDATGVSGPTGDASTILEALGRLNGAAAAIPLGAVNSDGTVAWDRLDDVDDVPAAGTDPYEVAQWWGSLTVEQQEALLEDSPESIGNLDGIPVLVRDQANRALLPDQISALQAEMDADFPNGEPPQFLQTGRSAVRNPRYAQWEALNARLQGAEDLQAFLDENADLEPPYFLIGSQPDVGNGRAIVSRGNPDLADHVSTYVPGTYSQLDGMTGDITRSDKMWRAATAENNGTVAAITWVGYEAPQSIPWEAGQMGFAEDAEPAVDSFMHGLRATHEGPASHNTILGHSYGSTVVGYAADRGLPVDDVILVASPGAGVGSGWWGTGSVDDFELDGESAGHVYAIRSQSDEIRMATDWAPALGRDPISPGFGATPIGADPDGDHSAYWDDYEGPSLTGMGQVIAGNGAQVAPPGPDEMPNFGNPGNLEMTGP